MHKVRTIGNEWTLCWQRCQLTLHVVLNVASFLPGVFDPTEVIDAIRQLYKTREGWLAPFPWCEEFHFHLKDIFTRLKMVKRKKTRGTSTSDIVKMSAIFQPHEECPKPRTVLIEGNPGMGKTTYCKKLAYDWAMEEREEDCFPKFQVLLLLKCHDIKSDLWEAIEDQLLPREIQEDEREKFFDFIRRNQSKVLLVLDGLDELPSGNFAACSEIFQGRMLPRCHLVVTARHEAGITVRKFCDTLLQIEGFTEEDARNFIVKYFKTMNDLAQKLLYKLRNDEKLRDLAANPLNTALLCLLCEDFQGIFPESRTELYMEIVLCVLRRYRKKNGQPETSEDLMEVYKTQLKHLGSIALNGLLEDNMYFEERELKNHTTDLPGFGFLAVQPGGSIRRPCLRYGFLHKSFQEFFAGYYLCCQLLSKAISPESLVADTGYFHELQQVFLFTCGMLAARSEETAVALVKSITSQVNKGDWNDFYFALKCIGECKKKSSYLHVELAHVFGSVLTLQSLNLIGEVLQDASVSVLSHALKVNLSLIELELAIDEFSLVTALAEGLKINATLTKLKLHSEIGAAGAIALAEALKVNTALTELLLWDSNIGAAGAVALAEGLKVNTALTELSLWDSNIDDAGAVALAEGLKVNTALTELFLWDNNIDDAGAVALAEGLKVNTALTELYLAGNNIGAAGAVALAEGLKVNTALTKLHLSDNNIGAAGAVALAEGLKVNTALTKLYLDANNIGAAGAVALAEGLKVNTALTKLHLSDNNIGAAGAVALAEGLKVNTALTELHLINSNIGAAGAVALAEGLKVNTALTELYLDANNIGAAGAVALAEGLKVNTALTELYLVNSNIGAAGAVALAEGLKVNTALTELSLDGNDIGADGAAGLAEALKVNTALTKLYLINNNIGAAGAVALAEARKVNTSLTKLHLSDNNIGAAGAVALAEGLKVNTALTELYLDANNIGAAGAVALAEGLKVNTALTELHLSDNNIGAAGAVALAEGLKVNTALTELYLVNNNIGAAGAVALAEARKVNTSLKVFFMEDYDIGADGDVALAEARK